MEHRNIGGRASNVAPAAPGRHDVHWRTDADTDPGIIGRMRDDGVKSINPRPICNGTPDIRVQTAELTIVEPTFNERANIAPFLALLEMALSGISWEAVFVDDDSPDGTAELISSVRNDAASSALTWKR